MPTPPCCEDYPRVKGFSCSDRIEGGRSLSASSVLERKNSEVLVTIITVAFNAAATLDCAIRSVLSQDHQTLEYIIIDGGSTDGTVDVLRAYGDRLDYFCSEPDCGISDAFNKGIALARGEVIGLLNADDWYMPGAISSAIGALQENPAFDFVFGDLTMEGPGGRCRVEQKGDPAYLRQLSKGMPSVPHPTVFVRRNVFTSFGLFRTDLKTAMDYEWLVRISRQGVRGLYLPMVLAGMRLGGASDIGFVGGYLEVYRVSTAYGYPRLLAMVHFAARVVKGVVRRIFERWHLHWLVAGFRRLVRSRFHYR
ncbi:glycosyltransferase family 2 protein [Trichloromonas sp.]|uniref:glycosyltransferase family 2 protein n=1 Tax=Trichloromonas sp. TaxID=3069249 RepID=UPI003D81698D